MALLVDSLVPSAVYNALPLISEVAAAPDTRSLDLEDLRTLLRQHNVPKGVSVRLLHKHFDTTQGEVMVLQNVPVPGHGHVKILKPVVPDENSQLRGIHFFVTEDAGFQAYEYAIGNAPEIGLSHAFLAEFASLVVERGLQRTFGLKLLCEEEGEEEQQAGWTEFELHTKRGTIMFPKGMPMPASDEIDFTVTTEWEGIVVEEATNPLTQTTACAHTSIICHHCKGHKSKAAEEIVDDYCVGGQKILPGTAMHDIVRQIVAAF
ncbi:hypothetical protein CCM_02445 [Cordyceps militaris CM01]|uniref:Uncharacterized protein n=1 Tax=Cordyceps militaris (strain CM01) TaxID=983644 RepID=G3J9V1_CORMM|nr:uncharacterized protein CCM_02445 [Cordyceps militaris CM01]EGX94174.1 hypothetical protein CCM_02445 [Cordyceps militaris CM01]